MSAQVIYSNYVRAHVVQVTLDADEAENIAYALGLGDMGAQELLAAANRARDLNADGAR